MSLFYEDSENSAVRLPGCATRFSVAALVRLNEGHLKEK
jgi:hypothetical protein